MHPAWLDGLAGLDRDPDCAPLLFQLPVRRIAIDIAGPPRIAQPLDPCEAAPFALVAKLGAKSWRDGGSLRIIDDGASIAEALAGLLRATTDHQRRYLAQLHAHTARIDLSLYRYVDLSRISEARWQVRGGRAWRSSQCRRAMPEAVLSEAQEPMRDAALTVCRRLGRDAIVDCTVEASGAVRVLDINPTRSVLTEEGEAA